MNTEALGSARRAPDSADAPDREADPITRARVLLDRLEDRPDVATLVALDNWANAAKVTLDRLEAGELGSEQA